MKVNGKNYRTVWFDEKKAAVYLIDQNLLPFQFKIFESKTYEETAEAILSMMVRGAGAIGAAAGYAMAQAVIQAPKESYISFIENARHEIESTRPTAQNLFWATKAVFDAAKISKFAAIKEAHRLAEEDMAASLEIGIIGSELIKDGAQIATHCNAGWLAFVDYGTALSPIYQAYKENKNIFVYVNETRPRGQGARLTAWELHQQNIPHKIIADNATAFLMMQGKIDIMIVGADRIARNGDVANKIGTLEKAIVAKEFGVPFYVAAPTYTFDLNCASGSNIPIEERNIDEILFQDGINIDGEHERILVASPGSSAYNPAFDVTPAKYITGIITEKGIIEATEEAIAKIF